MGEMNWAEKLRKECGNLQVSLHAANEEIELLRAEVSHLKSPAVVREMAARVVWFEKTGSAKIGDGITLEWWRPRTASGRDLPLTERRHLASRIATLERHGYLIEAAEDVRAALVSEMEPEIVRGVRGEEVGEWTPPLKDSELLGEG